MVIANSESSTMIAITIHYFPTDKKQLELLKMTDKLNEIFSDYTINLAGEDAISISEISIDMIDNVLQYRIDTTIDKDVNMFEGKGLCEDANIRNGGRISMGIPECLIDLEEKL